MSELNTILAKRQDTLVNVGDVLASLASELQLTPLLKKILLGKRIVEAAMQASLNVSVEEMQTTANRFRYRVGLTTADATLQWLLLNGLTLDSFQATIERELLVDQFKEHLLAVQGGSYFAANKERFQRAKIRRILVATEEIANELLTRIQEEGKDFGDLAKEYSQDSRTRDSGGDMGVVVSHLLPPALATRIFSAKVGSVIGPLASLQGIELVLVETLEEPVFDERTQATIREDLFVAWSQEQLMGIEFDYTALATPSPA